MVGDGAMQALLVAAQQQDADDASRAASLQQLQQLFLQSPGGVRRSWLRLCHGLEQVAAADKAGAVRRAAAAAYGALAAGGGTAGERFVGWALALLGEGRDEDGAEVAMAALQEFVGEADAGWAEGLVGAVVKGCHGVLEGGGVGMGLVRPVVALLGVVGERYSGSLEAHFRDTVDLLLGWALEVEVAEGDRQLIRDTLLRFSRLWFGSLSFSRELLGKLVEDMVAVTEEEEEEEEAMQRLLPLASCFTAVWKATVAGGVEAGEVRWVVAAARELLPGLLACFAEVGKKQAEYAWVAQAGECMVVFAEVLGAELGPFHSRVVEVVMQGVARAGRTGAQLRWLLRLNAEVMGLVGVENVGVEAARTMVEGLGRLRVHPNRAVTGGVAATYLMLVRGGSGEVVAEVRRWLVEEVKAVKGLVGGEEEQGLVKMDLMLLVGSAKGGGGKEVRGVVAREVNPFQAPVRDYPELQLAVMRVLHRLDVAVVEEGEGELFESSDMIAQGLGGTAGVKVEALCWVCSLCELGKEKQKKERMPWRLLRVVLKGAGDKEAKVREKVGKVLEMLAEAEGMEWWQMQAVAERALEQVGDEEEALASMYGRIVVAFAPATLWRCGWDLGGEGGNKWLGRWGGAQLRPQQLVCVMKYIAQRWQVLPAQWLQRLEVHAGGRKEEEEEGRSNGNRLGGLWWCVQEGARQCVAVRLRTHLGGPTHTFAAVERMLVEVVQAVQAEGVGGADTHVLLPMRLLLEFVEALKKNIYNAFEGCVVLPAPSAGSALFFRANRKVCEEWFSRIREAYMDASVAIQCHPATLHQACWRLQELRARSKGGGDVGRLLRHASLALCRWHRAEELLGLHAWACSTLFKSEEVGSAAWMRGLALQAAGQYERAAAHFSHLLHSEDALAAMAADGVHFLIARTIDSYAAVADWEALDAWLHSLQALRAKHAGKAYAGALTTAGTDMNAIHALARFDAGDVQGGWSYLDLTPQSSTQLTADPRLALQRSEQMLLQAMMRPQACQQDMATARAMLQQPLLVAALDGLCHAAPYVMQLECIRVLEQQQEAEAEEHLFPPHASFHTLHQDCHLWLKLLRVYRCKYPASRLTLGLQLQLAKLARKQHNWRLAHRLLEMEEAQQRHHHILRLGFRLEAIMLRYAEEEEEEEEEEDAVGELWSFVRLDMMTSAAAAEEEEEEEVAIKAKACLKLACWLRRRRQRKREAGWLWSSEGAHPASLEEVVGAATKAATVMSPGMAKAWFCYASWCYERAKASFSGAPAMPPPTAFAQLLSAEAAHQGSSSGLTEVEVEQVRQVMPDASDEEVVQRVVYVMAAAAGAAGVEDSESEPPATLLWSQLVQVLVGEEEVVAQLMPIWWAVRERRVGLFGHAARGFLQYLSMYSHQQQRRQQEREWAPWAKRADKDSVLLASLYVLRIMLNYGVELEGGLQQGLGSVPPWPWQAITVQLFARVSSHPEGKVRKQLKGLLMALANVSPWAIVYPTLVDFNACPAEELEQLLGCLGRLHSQLVRDVQVMIGELGSITVLWEEQWLSTLQDLHVDVARRINTLKEEAARVAENPTLSHGEKARINAAKYSAIMAPVAVALERRLASTSRPAATPRELWFQSHFGAQLAAAIAAFKLPPSGPSASLADAWRPLDAIAASLANHQKKSVTVLADVSPVLASFNSSQAPVPGLAWAGDDSSSCCQEEDAKGGGSGSLVTVAAFEEQVFILSTKTKPKKLSLLGSDGHRYTFLLKGREDLRLDARIMQLLHAVNGMLSASRQQGLGVRHYSVTPISARAGLIQWVDNLTSMYSVFKAWQQRERARAQAEGSGNIPRPSDMFYGKIIPALKDKGLRKVMSRRDWPQEVKRKVLLELMKETPRQLLYRELWCASEGITAFSSRLHRFSASVAVMSMVGHVLGLGDRHLDNILVDFSSGDVIHIDYNVCFDKGMRLKIPEIVPFRLTQTIQAALGLTGVEGAFRASCEAVLEALHKNKELILMLLEVFVWDPLVEWMRGDGHDEATIGGEERKGMELAVTLSLFASRVQENRVPLQDHHDHLLATLPAAVSSLQALSHSHARYQNATGAALLAERNKASAAKREAAGRALVSEATGVLERARLRLEAQARELGQAKALVSDAANEFTHWVEQQGRVLDALRTASVPEVQAIGQLASPQEALSLTSAVLAAGVPLAVVPEPAQMHCKDVDREVAHLTSARHDALLHAARSLQAYALALQLLLPPSYVATSHVHTWAHILQLCVRQLSPDALAAARRQAAELLARSSGEHEEGVWNKHQAVRAQVERLANQASKLHKRYAELEASIDPDAEKKAKERLLAAFTRHLQGQEAADVGDEEKRASKLMLVLQSAAGTMYGEMWDKVSEWWLLEEEEEEEQWWLLQQVQEVSERCVLVAQIQQTIAQANGGGRRWDPAAAVSRCKECVAAVKELASQLLGVVLPEAIKAGLSHDPAVMEAFAGVSQIRGSVEAAVEQVVEMEMQRASLRELEKSYPDKFGEISERLAALEAAAVSGRDNLSWEEAEELASQEEACRAMQEQLHRAWAQRGAQASALAREEGGVRAALLVAEQRFESLVAIDRDADLHLVRGKVLLAALARLFSGLELLDQALGGWSSYRSNKKQQQQQGLVQCVWSKASHVLQDKTFFAWKVGMMDALLEACIRDSTPDVGLSLEQAVVQHKERLKVQLQRFLEQYVKERVCGVLLDWLAKQTQTQTQEEEEEEEEEVHAWKKEGGEPVKRALRLLRDYCDVHESARAAKAAAGSIKAQLDDITQALHSAQLEAAQLEWLHEAALSRFLPHTQFLGVPPSLAAGVDVKKLPGLCWWSRQQVLDNVRSAVAGIARATEGLLACEIPGSSAEEQLDRAMAWACAGSSSTTATTTSGGSGSGTRNVAGIPPEFHEHLRRRRQLLWSGQEQASGIVRLCEAVLNLEASREGYLSGLPAAGGAAGGKERREWQQSYQSLISRLESACLSFTRSELECQAAQKSMEVAGAQLASAADELALAAKEAEATASELQGATEELQERVVLAAAAVSGFCGVSRKQSALTVEMGSMLEEVLAITDGAAGAAEVHGLAREASAEHSRMMSDLNKVSDMLLPLEPSLVACSAAVGPGKELSNKEFVNGLQELLLPPLATAVPRLVANVRHLHATLIRLARTASSDAGLLHKALEGVGESQEVRSQEDVDAAAAGLEEEEQQQLVFADHPSDEPLVELAGLNTEAAVEEDDDGEGSWISPPDSCEASDTAYYLSSGTPLDHTSYFVEQSQSSESDMYSSKLALDVASRETQLGGGRLNSDAGSDQSSSLVSSEVASTSGTSQRGSGEPPAALFQKLSAESSKSFFAKAAGATQPTTAPDSVPASEKQHGKEGRSGLQAKQQSSKVKSSSFLLPSSGNSLALPEHNASSTREKNAYAVSVLKRVRMKLEGRDIDGTGHLPISDQVDYLLRQATSIDNLCNMYEGWTPWI